MFIFDKEEKVLDFQMLKNEHDKRIIEDLNKKGINPRTKEKRRDTYLVEMLRNNNLSEVDFQKMNMKILSYDLYI